MSLSAVLQTTLQSVLLNGSSNVIAQGITAYRHGAPLTLDYIQVARFMICTLITTPFMVLWQDQLEVTFPASSNEDGGRHPALVASRGDSVPNAANQKLARSVVQEDQPERRENQKASPKNNVRNTILKILIDQTVGAAWSSALFIVTISALNGQDARAVQQSLYKDFFPIITAGLKLWPMVSVISFTIVPPEKRVLTGSLFGMIWGIYLSLRTED
ncbi:hypothetical protein ACJ72_00665 [Emergomyces africanus]|uniref:Integral membrane protein, Mpv17/PMP22 family n=1 Tax=Emergomyces africanus TaxID=1955775 RepID=A0A1B7P7J3_9EURO|nr:hypothetical protein ACJ72_00665 [Emergomyces africanus]